MKIFKGLAPRIFAEPAGVGRDADGGGVGGPLPTPAGADRGMDPMGGG